MQGAKLFIPGMVPLLKEHGGWLNLHYLTHYDKGCIASTFCCSGTVYDSDELQGVGQHLWKNPTSIELRSWHRSRRFVQFFHSKKKHIYRFQKGKKINSLIDFLSWRLQQEPSTASTIIRLKDGLSPTNGTERQHVGVVKSTMSGESTQLGRHIIGEAQGPGSCHVTGDTPEIG